MSESSRNEREISLGDGFGEVVLKVNGATVEVHADGSIAAHTTGDVDAYTVGSVRGHAAANDGLLVPAAASAAHRLLAANTAVAPAELKPGDRMLDGTVFAGISPDTGKAMHVAPSDAPGSYTFDEARNFASGLLGAYGQKDWRVPTRSELNVLWENRNKGKLKGTFNETGLLPAGWYGSSSPSGDRNRYAQRFSNGFQYIHSTLTASSLRCVRG